MDLDRKVIRVFKAKLAITFYYLYVAFKEIALELAKIRYGSAHEGHMVQPVTMSGVLHREVLILNLKKDEVRTIFMRPGYALIPFSRTPSEPSNILKGDEEVLYTRLRFYRPCR